MFWWTSCGLRLQLGLAPQPALSASALLTTMYVFSLFLQVELIAAHKGAANVRRRRERGPLPDATSGPRQGRGRAVAQH